MIDLVKSFTFISLRLLFLLLSPPHSSSLRVSSAFSAPLRWRQTVIYSWRSVKLDVSFHINKLVQIHRSQAQINPRRRRRSINALRQISQFRHRLSARDAVANDRGLPFQEALRQSQFIQSRVAGEGKLV